jgi:hypothetical protein
MTNHHDVPGQFPALVWAVISPSCWSRRWPYLHLSLFARTRGRDGGVRKYKTHLPADPGDAINLIVGWTRARMGSSETIVVDLHSWPKPRVATLHR